PTPDTTPGKPLDTSPGARAIVAAFAARAKLGLREGEHQRLVQHVADSGDRADKLRDGVTPGDEGMAEELPLRAAYSNWAAEGEPGSAGSEGPASAAGAAGAPTGIPARSEAARPLPDSTLEGGVVHTARAVAAGELTPLDL